jgi:5-methylcytosine-specific restriction endonuclease McrA
MVEIEPHGATIVNHFFFPATLKGYKMTESNQPRKINKPKNAEERAINAQYQKEWNAANPDKVRARQQADYYRDVEKSRQYHRDRYANDPQRLIEAAAREERKAARPSERERNRAWVAANLEKRRAYARASNAKRSAQKAGGIVENFTHTEIFDRDQWICGICQEPIDPDRRRDLPNGRHDMLSVSLDHIIPISKGGDHIRANVQASHLGCNVSKNDSVDQDLDSGDDSL